MSNTAVVPRKGSVSFGQLGDGPGNAVHAISQSPRSADKLASHSRPFDTVSEARDVTISPSQLASPSSVRTSPPPPSSSTDKRRITPMSPRQQQRMTDDEPCTSVHMLTSDEPEERDKDRSYPYVQTRTNSFPSPPQQPLRDFLQRDPHPSHQHSVVNRTQSLRAPVRSSSGDDSSLSRSSTWRLPSHHRDSVNEEGQYIGKHPSTPSKNNRRLMSPSASMSLLANSPSSTNDVTSASPFQTSTSQSRSSWSRNARRWSSSLPRGRDSAAFAFRLAEGASPYLRAGLEELRSIFDVDSNPIPSSPFIDEYEDDDDGGGGGDEEYATRRASKDSDGEEGCCHTARNTSTFLSINGGDGVANGTMTSSPGNLSSREQSPSRGSIALRRTSSDERRRSAEDRSSSWSRSKGSGSSSSGGSYFAKMPVRPSHHHRGESMLLDDLRQRPYNNRQFLACSLCVIAVGLTALAAWGYAMQSDTFSITLIGFFLTQPAFALAALASLLLRKRTWMDLCSRAIRAHVLAQALIVILAYLDLSASSSYVSSSRSASDFVDDSQLRLHRPLRSRFSMVPSMEMRFGPLYGAREAADGPISSFVRGRGGGGATTAAASTLTDGTAWSIHAHDSSVGDWRSRITHLIVFLVQAAVPIFMLLVGQYIVAQRLAWLARQGTLSRQGSMRQQQQLHDSGAALKSPSIESQPQYASRPAVRTNVVVSRLDIPSPTSARRDLPPLLRLPGGGGDSTRSARQEQQRRRRLATASGIPEHVTLSSQVEVPIMTSSVPQTPPNVHDESRFVTPPAHRHNRSVSQPVNLSELASKAMFPASMTPSSSTSSSSGSNHAGEKHDGTGLGVTLAPANR